MGAEIQDGAVVVARAITNSSLWTMRVADRILAITCICMANWKERKWFDGHQATVIGRGQFVTSLENLAEAANLSLQTTRTSLRNLEKVGFLTRKVTHHWTLVTVCKYAHYQKMGNYYNTESNTPSTAAQQQANNKQEGEEGKECPVAQSGSSAFLAKKWNTGPGQHLGGEAAREQIQAAIDVGVNPQDIDVAFTDHAAIKGKKIWDVLDPMRKAIEQKAFAERRDGGIRKI